MRVYMSSVLGWFLFWLWLSPGKGEFSLGDCFHSHVILLSLHCSLKKSIHLFRTFLQALEFIFNWRRKSLSCAQLFGTLWTVHGILQARILGWVAFPFSRRSSQARDWTQVSCTAGRFFTSWATREAQEYCSGWPIPSPADLPHPGIEPGSPALQADSLPAELSGKPYLLDISRPFKLNMYKLNSLSSPASQDVFSVWIDTTLSPVTRARKLGNWFWFF